MLWGAYGMVQRADCKLHIPEIYYRICLLKEMCIRDSPHPILCTRGVGIPIRFMPAAPLPSSPPAPVMQRALQGTLSLG